MVNHSKIFFVVLVDGKDEWILERQRYSYSTSKQTKSKITCIHIRRFFNLSLCSVIVYFEFPHLSIFPCQSLKWTRLSLTFLCVISFIFRMQFSHKFLFNIYIVRKKKNKWIFEIFFWKHKHNSRHTKRMLQFFICCSIWDKKKIQKFIDRNGIKKRKNIFTKQRIKTI